MWCLFFWDVPTWVRARSSEEGGFFGHLGLRQPLAVLSLGEAPVWCPFVLVHITESGTKVPTPDVTDAGRRPWHVVFETFQVSNWFLFDLEKLNGEFKSRTRTSLCVKWLPVCWICAPGAGSSGVCVCVGVGGSVRRPRNILTESVLCWQNVRMKGCWMSVNHTDGFHCVLAVMKYPDVTIRNKDQEQVIVLFFFPKGFLSLSVSEKSGKNTWTEMMMYLSITAPWCHPPCEIQAVSTVLSTVGVIFCYCSSYSCCSAGDVTLNTGTLLETMDLPAWLSVGEGSQLALPISAADGSETWPFVSWGAEAALHEVPPLSPSLS